MRKLSLAVVLQLDKISWSTIRPETKVQFVNRTTEDSIFFFSEMTIIEWHISFLSLAAEISAI